MTKLMYKTKTKSEKVARWILLVIMSIFTIYLTYLRMGVYPYLTKYEFASKVWGGGNWIYLVLFVIVCVILYVKSNWSQFKQLK